MLPPEAPVTGIRSVAVVGYRQLHGGARASGCLSEESVAQRRFGNPASTW